uniref:Crustin 3 n=1 Tax=Panulirus japonicus TaxID=6736 RepID=C7B730_PANJA|nr:crustin 3 [Panulirus japonicus]
MLKLVLLCVLGLALGQQDGNTRFFDHELGGGVVDFHGGGVGGIHGLRPNCRYWCKQPDGEYHCCDGEKPGNCPIVRLDCPPTRTFAGPQTCSNDRSCAGSDKCCYDTCLRERVCKPAEFPFGGR